MLSLVRLYPLIYRFLAGFFTAEEYNTLLESGEMGLIPIPTAWTVKNYLAIFALSDYPMLPVYFLNSLARTVYSTGLTVITVMMCGYAFSRLRFKGSRVLLLRTAVLLDDARHDDARAPPSSCIRAWACTIPGGST